MSDGRWSRVLDWETVHLGDPHEDLGWVTNPLRAREHRDSRAAGSRADLLDRWSVRTGLAVEPEAVRWWSVLANFKLSVIVLSGRAPSSKAGSTASIRRRRDHRLMLDMIGA